MYPHGRREGQFTGGPRDGRGRAAQGATQEADRPVRRGREPSPRRWLSADKHMKVMELLHGVGFHCRMSAETGRIGRSQVGAVVVDSPHEARVAVLLEGPDDWHEVRSTELTVGRCCIYGCFEDCPDGIAPAGCVPPNDDGRGHSVRMCTSSRAPRMRFWPEPNRSGLCSAARTRMRSRSAEEGDPQEGMWEKEKWS